MCAIYDAEPFYEGGQLSKLTATQPVTCTECERTIHVGESYELVRGRVDESADWEEWRTCQHCRAAGAWLDKMCGGWPLDTLREELHEHALEYPSSELLPDLCMFIDARWLNGDAAVPNTEALSLDAEACMAAEVA